jgi:DNA-binding CsgD family transcriptional regulator
MEKNERKEQEIYDQLIKGCSIMEILDQTGIPISTIGHYKKNSDRQSKVKTLGQG